MKQITKRQLAEIEDATLFGTKAFHDKLEEITGITANPYTAYTYHDEAGDYIGDSENSGIPDLLRAAYIEVVDDEM